MEGNSHYSEAELRDAGASASFIAYYLTAHDMGESTAATSHVDSDHRSLEDVAECPGMGGGFFKSLWNANPRGNSANPYGADAKNQQILREAGVYPAPA